LVFRFDPFQRVAHRTHIQGLRTRWGPTPL
jgi:hypothetical protein